MSTRTTQKELERTIEIFNRRTGQDLELEMAYGGFKICSHKGSRDLSPRGTKNETYTWLWAYINGFDAATRDEDSSVYLHFFHGRETLEEQMNDWGSDGPVVRVNWAKTTYGNFTVGFGDGDFTELAYVGDCYKYDGIYYGDMDILTPQQLKRQGFDSSVEEFDKTKGAA